MNYVDSLRKAARAHSTARAEAALREAQRDDLIRKAHRAGGLSTREIAESVGLSFQRVATIVAGEQDRADRVTLHGAMHQVLSESDGDWLRAHDIARAVFVRKLYRRRDGGVIHPSQIRARAARYPELFEGSHDGSNRVRLRSSD
jgi:hypothetical protein